MGVRGIRFESENGEPVATIICPGVKELTWESNGMKIGERIVGMTGWTIGGSIASLGFQVWTVV